MAKYNDLDMKCWKEYEDIKTDTLWIYDKRDNSGQHNGAYHGNFIPQIPNQLLKRYTKKGDFVLDPFMGSGTTLIEAQKLGRNSIGVELKTELAQEVKNRLTNGKNNNVQSIVVNGNSKNIDYKEVLFAHNIGKVQFVIFHPPYWDIIKFSEEKEDLSNSTTLKEFLGNFSEVVDNAMTVLEKDRYFAIVIGDKYANQEIVPLGFYCMRQMQLKGHKLKAIIVKNFEETKAKLNQKAIWRYRALASDFYLFKHEYIFVFKK